MARRLCWLFAAVALSGCLPDAPPPPAVELDLYDQDVACDEATGRCLASGAPAGPEYHRAPVSLRELPASAGYPQGALMVSFSLHRPSGSVAWVELEIPVDVTSPSSPPLASLVETTAGKVTFDASRVGGRVEISWDGGCPCQTGRFELLFTDPGPDGALDTADDRHRRLSRGRLRRGARPFCHGRAILPLKPGLLVVGARACPARRSNGGAGVGACAWGGAGWASGWNDDGWYDEEWDGDWDGGGYDDGWDEEEWTEEGWDEGCEPCDDGWFGGGSSGGGWDSPSGGWGDDGSDDWGDDDWGDDWWDDGSDSGDDGWDSDDGWDDGGDDWGDDGWDSGDDGDDWGDDWWDD